MPERHCTAVEGYHVYSVTESSWRSDGAVHFATLVLIQLGIVAISGLQEGPFLVSMFR